MDTNHVIKAANSQDVVKLRMPLKAKHTRLRAAQDLEQLGLVVVINQNVSVEKTTGQHVLVNGVPRQTPAWTMHSERCHFSEIFVVLKLLYYDLDVAAANC